MRKYIALYIYIYAHCLIYAGRMGFLQMITMIQRWGHSLIFCKRKFASTELNLYFYIKGGRRIIFSIIFSIFSAFWSAGRYRSIWPYRFCYPLICTCRHRLKVHGLLKFVSMYRMYCWVQSNNFCMHIGSWTSWRGACKQRQPWFLGTTSINCTSAPLPSQHGT